jgi:hypothetical protein
MTKTAQSEEDRIREVAHSLLIFTEAVTSLDVYRQAQADPSECFRAMATDPTLQQAGWRSGQRTFAEKS